MVMSMRPWRFGPPLCLRGRLSGKRTRTARQLPGQRGTQARLHSRGSPSRQSFRMTTKGIDQYLREISTPIPSILEQSGDENRNKDWLERAHLIFERMDSTQAQTCKAADKPITPQCSREPTARRMGTERSRSKRKCLSTDRETWEVRPSKRRVL